MKITLCLACNLTQTPEEIMHPALCLNLLLSLQPSSSMLSARCKYYFDSLLFQRGYTGSMTFNHNDETLFISVRKLAFFSPFL